MFYRIDYGVIGEYLRCMLFHLIAWEEFTFLIVFITIFGLSFYKTRLGIYGNSYLLVWLVVMHSKVFKYLFIITIIICNVALWLVHHQKSLLPPAPHSPTQNWKLHIFTLRHTNVQNHAKVLFLHLHLNGFTQHNMDLHSFNIHLHVLYYIHLHKFF
jgi:hypothetical protein